QCGRSPAGRQGQACRAARRSRRRPRDLRAGGRAGALRCAAAPHHQLSGAGRPDRLRRAASRLLPCRPGHRAHELPRARHRVRHPHMAGPAETVTDASARDLRFAALPDLADAIEQWLGWLTHERRNSVHTIDGYARDLKDLLRFLELHRGETPRLADFAAADRSDFRSWMAARSTRGIEAASTARALSAIKNFARFLAKRGLAQNGVLGGMRNPKLPRSVPKPLNAVEAEDTLDAIADLHDAEWIGKRDLAV